MTRDATPAARLHRRLVDGLVAKGAVRTPAIEAAFRAVPRHVFLPGVAAEEAYRDDHVTTKESRGRRLSSSTAPWLMAGMLEQLRPRAGQRILEIGAGTGYNAAILAHLLGEDGQVLSVDIDDEVVDGARRSLAELGWRGESHPAGCAPIETRTADGFAGDADGAPWDGILVTVRTARVAEAWREQLAPGGSLVVPLALGGVRHGQLSIAFEAAGDHLSSRSFFDCGFIRPRGEMAMDDREIQLSERPGLLWSDAGRHPWTADRLLALLEGRREVHASGLEARTPELAIDFQPWLVVHDRDTCSLLAEKSWARWDGFLPMAEKPDKVRGSGGLFDGRGVALLGFEEPPGRAPRELFVAGYGESDVAERLLGHLSRWHELGRPSRRRMRVRLFAAGRAPDPAEDGGVLLREPWGELLVDWP